MAAIRESSLVTHASMHNCFRPFFLPPLISNIPSSKISSVPDHISSIKESKVVMQELSQGPPDNLLNHTFFLKLRLPHWAAEEAAYLQTDTGQTKLVNYTMFRPASTTDPFCQTVAATPFWCTDQSLCALLEYMSFSSYPTSTRSANSVSLKIIWNSSHLIVS